MKIILLIRTGQTNLAAHLFFGLRRKGWPNKCWTVRQPEGPNKRREYCCAVWQSNYANATCRPSLKLSRCFISFIFNCLNLLHTEWERERERERASERQLSLASWQAITADGQAKPQARLHIQLSCSRWAQLTRHLKCLRVARSLPKSFEFHF